MCQIVFASCDVIIRNTWSPCGEQWARDGTSKSLHNSTSPRSIPYFTANQTVAFCQPSSGLLRVRSCGGLTEGKAQGHVTSQRSLSSHPEPAHTVSLLHLGYTKGNLCWSPSPSPIQPPRPPIASPSRVPPQHASILPPHQTMAAGPETETIEKQLRDLGQPTGFGNRGQSVRFGSSPSLLPAPAEV